ncbi:CopG family transcriptional regulator [Nitrospirillum bahiense]|uniref:CopG family transcriptional regulator n=1 Tax=Nitrospirillum amazonense TaxID=28077 RepID=A0A560FUS0_9PROT|nr:CopG family transcriptional regulator [Nitrospirillum amazonense]TWB25339.1 hypothetical protein FBZ88_11095 [Nitrospirillum amazonense]
MTQPASIFDIVDEDAKRCAIKEARASVAAGNVVDHDVVVEWLEQLLAGKKVPPPSSSGQT